jgi:DNA polymerase
MRTHRGATTSASPSQPFAQSFDAHLAAVAPRIVLAMGPLSAQALLRRNEPIGKLRGQAAELPGATGVQVVATYHPAYLLRNRGDKAKAWADLCLAADQF